MEMASNRICWIAYLWRLTVTHLNLPVADSVYIWFDSNYFDTYSGACTRIEGQRVERRDILITENLFQFITIIYSPQFIYDLNAETHTDCTCRVCSAFSMFELVWRFSIRIFWIFIRCESNGVGVEIIRTLRLKSTELCGFQQWIGNDTRQNSLISTETIKWTLTRSRICDFRNFAFKLLLKRKSIDYAFGIIVNIIIRNTLISPSFGYFQSFPLFLKDFDRIRYREVAIESFEHSRTRGWMQQQ